MRSLARWMFPMIVAAIALGGCAPSMKGDTYSRDQARKVQRVDEGEIILVREVTIEGTRSGLGMIAGGIAGGVLGSMVGGGKGQTLGTLGGAAAGAAGGAAAEEAGTREKGLEITVKLENGEVVSIVQGADREYRVGDEVKVLRNPDGTARVIQ